MNVHVIDSFDQRNVVDDFVVDLGLHNNYNHEFAVKMIIQVVNDAVIVPGALLYRIIMISI